MLSDDLLVEMNASGSGCRLFTFERVARTGDLDDVGRASREDKTSPEVETARDMEAFIALGHGAGDVNAAVEHRTA